MPVSPGHWPDGDCLFLVHLLFVHPIKVHYNAYSAFPPACINISKLCFLSRLSLDDVKSTVYSVSLFPQSVYSTLYVVTVRYIALLTWLVNGRPKSPTWHTRSSAIICNFIRH